MFKYLHWKIDQNTNWENALLQCEHCCSQILPQANTLYIISLPQCHLLHILQHKWETGTRRTNDSCFCSVAESCELWRDSAEEWAEFRSGGHRCQTVLAERLNRDRGDKSSGQVATLAQKVNVQFARPSGHKWAIDSRPETRQMPAILKQMDYCRSKHSHLSEQRDTHPPSSSVLLRREEIWCFLWGSYQISSLFLMGDVRNPSYEAK